MKTKEDTKPYVICMTKVRQRIQVVRWLMNEDPLGPSKSMLTTELAFIQFRKILELIAYSTLTGDAAGQVLHMRNPFSTRDPLETIQYTELEYANRIQNLLSRHVTRMVDGKTAWIVNVPGSGPVKMLPAKVEV